MKTMRTLVAILGVFSLAAVGCSSSSSSDKETLPKAATYEPENFEEDTTTTVDNSTDVEAETTTEDRTPVSGSDSLETGTGSEPPSTPGNELMEPSDSSGMGSESGTTSEDESMTDDDKKQDTGTDVGSGGTAPDSSGM